MLITAQYFLNLVKRNKKISETIIPELIHRLIRETISDNAYTRFPSYDDVFTPGFDGVVKENTTKHRYLPLGNIYFEIGSNTDCCKAISKIDSDYRKRKTDNSIEDKKNYTYIAVTTSILNSTNKQTKCDKYIKENVF